MVKRMYRVFYKGKQFALPVSILAEMKYREKISVRRNISLNAKR